MHRLQGRHYLPALRTRDSELKAYEHLSAQVKESLLPVFELTRSRRSKSNPDGSVLRTVERLATLALKLPFIADITSLDSQGNAETAALLDPADGFRNWCDFVATHLPSGCIPVVHLTDPFDMGEFFGQYARLKKHSNAVALRVPTDYVDVASLAAALLPIQGRADGGCIVLLVDDGYVKQGEASASALRCMKIANAFAGKVDLVAPLTSSFPNSVTAPGFGGGDAYGEFRLEEVAISDEMKMWGLPGARVVHGDFGLIHPFDFEGTVTNWVPRVDVPLTTTGYYYRYRRPAGGYNLAAALAVRDPKYAQLNCWAHDMIAAAAGGKPEGRSPSFWISVRVNYHLNRQAVRLSANLSL